MRYLFDELKKIKHKLSGKSLFLFLDCDGTLAPIVDTPQQAVISPETKSILKKLASNFKCRVAVVSGRSLADIKEKVGIKNIIYAGNHGFEVEGPKIKHALGVPAGYKKILSEIKRQLEAKLRGIPGVFIEDKGFSLVMHFRLADKVQVPLIKTAFQESTILYAVKNKIKAREGKKIFEVIPPLRWDKGKIVLWLLARQQALAGNKKIIPIYLGDDVTDEDAFKAIKMSGLTVFVGQAGPSLAKYYLRDVAEVRVFLQYILDMVGQKN